MIGLVSAVVLMVAVFALGTGYLSWRHPGSIQKVVQGDRDRGGAAGTVLAGLAIARLAYELVADEQLEPRWGLAVVLMLAAVLASMTRLGERLVGALGVSAFILVTGSQVGLEAAMAYFVIAVGALLTIALLRLVRLAR